MIAIVDVAQGLAGPSSNRMSIHNLLFLIFKKNSSCTFLSTPPSAGKTYSMLGSDSNPSGMGAIPCAIAWLFRLIDEQKERTGARFSVRVSAVEVHGREERLKDLLADLAKGECGGRFRLKIKGPGALSVTF